MQKDKPQGSVRRVDLVDQEVDDDAGDGDVEPEGKGPAGDKAVLIEAFEPSATERDDDERHDSDRQQSVRDQNGEVDRADPALSLEEDHLVNAEMVNHVGNQESTGDDHGGDHEDFVDVALAGTDGGVTGGKENGTGAVKRGVEGGVGEHRGCDGSTREFVVHHEAEKDGDVEDGGVHEPLGASVGLGGGGPQTDLNQSGAGDESAEKVEHAGKTHDRGQQADGNKRGCVENDLTEGARAVCIDEGKHENSGAGVVFAVHPGDGVEVGELPNEENGEEKPSAGVEFTGGGGPADHRGNGAGNRADEGGPDGALFERRVGEEVAERSENAEQAGDVASGEVEVDGTGKSEREAEAQGFGGGELAGGQRARGGA